MAACPLQHKHLHIPGLLEEPPNRSSISSLSSYQPFLHVGFHTSSTWHQLHSSSLMHITAHTPQIIILQTAFLPPPKLSGVTPPKPLCPWLVCPQHITHCSLLFTTCAPDIFYSRCSSHLNAPMQFCPCCQSPSTHTHTHAPPKALPDFLKASYVPWLVM